MYLKPLTTVLYMHIRISKGRHIHSLQLHIKLANDRCLKHWQDMLPCIHSDMYRRFLLCQSSIMNREATHFLKLSVNRPVKISDLNGHAG
jgi:hypothetical protein